MLAHKTLPDAVVFYIVGKHCEDGSYLLLKLIKVLHEVNEGGPPCEVLGVEDLCIIFLRVGSTVTFQFPLCFRSDCATMSFACPRASSAPLC